MFNYRILGFASGFVIYFTELKSIGKSFPYSMSILPLVGFGFIVFLLIILLKKMNDDAKSK